MRIKAYRIHDRQCNECNNFDLTVKIYKDYFHFWFIPIIPTGVKSTKIQCNNCGSPMRSDSLAKEYEAKTRVPFYLYGGVLLVVVFVLALVGASWFSDSRNKGYIAQPRVGDVYEIKRDKPVSGTYTFARIMGIHEDTVMLFENNKMYLQAGSTFDEGDYFSQDRVLMSSKEEVKNMFDNKIIVDVSRRYDTTTGFNRIK